MMHRSSRTLVWPALILSAMLVSTAQAQEEGDTPIPEGKQTKLLEKFGDQGIDANDDGTLTQDEVHAFFAEKSGKGAHGKCNLAGKHGNKGKGHKGEKGCEHHGRHGAQNLDGEHNAQGHGPDGNAGCKHQGLHEEHGNIGHGQKGREGCEYGGLPGHAGMGKRGGDPLHRVIGLLHRLKMLEAETPPAEFDLDRFGEADSDGDGQISASEWSAIAEQHRTMLLARLARHAPDADTDEDGTINDAELEALWAKVRERMLARHPEADTNDDGVLDEAESEALHAKRDAERRAELLEHHPEADLDGDGSLSDEEMEQFGPKRRGLRGPKHGRGHGGHGAGHDIL